MSDATLKCQRCSKPLPSSAFNDGEFHDCPNCDAKFKADVFPALFRPDIAGSAGQPVLVEEEASCFFHPSKKASVHCSSCGRFLCALCDIDLGDRHLCPKCVNTKGKKGKIKDFENRRVRHDSIALAIVLFSMLFFFFLTPIGAPAALYYSIRHWKSPSSLVQPAKTRFVIAILLSTALIVLWTAIIYSFVS